MSDKQTRYKSGSVNQEAGSLDTIGEAEQRREDLRQDIRNLYGLSTASSNEINRQIDDLIEAAKAEERERIRAGLTKDWACRDEEDRAECSDCKLVFRIVEGGEQ